MKKTSSIVPQRLFASAKSKLAKYDFQDPLNLQSALTEDEIMIAEAARDFAQSTLLPGVTQSFRSESFDPSIYRQMGEIGLIGCTLKDYGAPGVSSVAYGLINREIERVDSGYRSALSVQSSLVIHPIHSFGSQKLKDKYLPKLITGEWIGSFGLTEPNHGSDPGSMETRATKKGDKYILNGSKTWITSSPLADVFVIWAKDDEQEIRGFVLDRSMKGISTPKIEGKVSLRASTTGMIIMEDVEVPEDHIFTTVKGLKGPFSCLNNARFGISWGVLGAAEACFHTAREYTLNRYKTP